MIFFSNLKTKVDLPDPVGPHMIKMNGFLNRKGSVNCFLWAVYNVISVYRPEITEKSLFSIKSNKSNKKK